MFIMPKLIVSFMARFLEIGFALRFNIEYDISKDT